MNGQVESVHVTFGWSRAESIRDALLLIGCNERVIGLPDDLSFGPINPPDANLRRSWAKSQLRRDLDGDWRYDDLLDTEKTWAEATAPNIYPVFWVCRRCAAEQASYLEFASRLSGRNFDIVDATDLDYTTADGVKTPWSLGLMRPTDIVASGLLAKRRLVSLAEMRAASTAWSRLREENAPFRIIKGGALASASLTYFDAVLTDQATKDWEVAAKLIGRTLTSLSYDMEPPGQSPSDVVLFGRMLALGETGMLDIMGPGPGMRDYQVRRTISVSPHEDA